MRVLLIAFLLVPIYGLFAQSGWDWGDDKITAQRKYQYVQTYMKSKRYAECQSTVNWLLVNTPNLHKELYNRAALVYKEVEKVETNPIKKRELQDSVLFIYDTWLSKFSSPEGNPSILNRKGKVYYKYYMTRDSVDLGSMQKFYYEVLDANGGKTYSKNVKYYMAIVLKRKKRDELTDEELFTAYNFSISVLEKKKATKNENTAEIAKIDKTEVQILNSMMKSVSMECSSVENHFKPLYKANPQDPELINSIRLLLHKNKCERTPFYLEIVKQVAFNDPSSVRFTYIAELELNNSNLDSAKYYFLEAVKLEASLRNKSELYFQLAKISRKKGKFSEGRRYAKKMIATGFQISKAHVYIGDLYFNSAGTCISKDELIKRSIYIAAYLEYEKGADLNKMKAAKTQFPSMEDIFVQSKKEGDIVNTGCWINENVPLKKR